MYKHRPGAEVHSASKSQLPVPHAASMEEKAKAVVSTVTVYCQGVCMSLLLAFSCDFIDAVEFWFVFFLYICFICFIWYKLGRFFLHCLPNRRAAHKISFGHLWNAFPLLGSALSYIITWGLSLLLLSMQGLATRCVKLSTESMQASGRWRGTGLKNQRYLGFATVKKDLLLLESSGSISSLSLFKCKYLKMEVLRTGEKYQHGCQS